MFIREQTGLQYLAIKGLILVKLPMGFITPLVQKMNIFLYKGVHTQPPAV